MSLLSNQILIYVCAITLASISILHTRELLVFRRPEWELKTRSCLIFLKALLLSSPFSSPVFELSSISNSWIFEFNPVVDVSVIFLTSSFDRLIRQISSSSYDRVFIFFKDLNFLAGLGLGWNYCGLSIRTETKSKSKNNLCNFFSQKNILIYLCSLQLFWRLKHT